MDGEVEIERLQNLQSIQVYLLRYALLNFPYVKRVIYSTCSVHPEENERVIDEVLSNVGDAYRLVPIKDMLRENWLNFSSPEYNCGDKCLYSRPDVDLCNGFFLAIFERNFEVPLPECKRKGGNANPEQLKLNTEKNNATENDGETTEKISRKKKKRGKKKKKTESMIDDETGETLEHADELKEKDEKLTEDEQTEIEPVKKKRKKEQEDKEAVEIDGGVERSKDDEQIEIELTKKKKKKKKKKEIDNNERME